MRFWLSRDASISIREQLTAQIVLGIMSRRYEPGQRLPSVRELARRLKIHANTVSAAYRDLAERGWVSRRAGAGVFVNPRVASLASSSVDALAEEYVRKGQAYGFTGEQLQTALARAVANSAVDCLAVVDPDLELARIVAAEIEEAIDAPVMALTPTDATSHLPKGACVLAHELHLDTVRAVVGERQVRSIQLKAMEDVLAGQTRPERAVLICVASRSEAILRWSATLLRALGFPPESTLLRDACQPEWQQGLGACDIVAMDILTAREAPAHKCAIPFRILANAFLECLRQLVTARKL